MQRSIRTRDSSIDDDYPLQWHLNNTGQLGGTPGEDIRAEAAWSIFVGSSAVHLGIIDSGVELTHDDLIGKSSGDSYTTGPNFHPDYVNHGTHVAGIAAALHGNVGRVRGVDANARVESRRIFQADRVSIPNNPAGYVGDAEAAQKILSAVDAGSHVLNNSWGGSSYSTTLRMAFAYAYKSNRTAVAAMGNNGTSETQYPAGFGQGIIAVGATTNTGVKASFSNFGNHIDVSAPGVLIWSTITGNRYDYMSGTSMAAPIVSGIASLLKGYNPNLYNDDIENIIKLSADDKGPAGWDPEYGTGRVNARKALDKLRPPNVLIHATATGGTDQGGSAPYQMTFFGADGLADGVYIVKRHEVRRTVNFPWMKNHAVWGRGVATVGWSVSNPNFAMGWCDIVPGTLTNTSVTLRTYVYEVWDILGRWIGWKPAHPSNVVFAYTLLGEQVPLSVYITGPSVAPCATGTWYAHASGGMPRYSYQWYQMYCNDTDVMSTTSDRVKPLRPSCEWTPVGTNSSTLQLYWCAGNGYLRVDVTDAQGNFASAQYYVQGAGGGGGEPVPNLQGEHKIDVAKPLPVEFSIRSYPNPFNPSATISYELPTDGFVRLSVFDVLGREIEVLVDEVKPAGFYDVSFDASHLPSGVYFARILVTSNEGGSLIQTIKMVLTKQD